MGKRTRLTRELQTQICGFVNGGAPLPTACQAAGVPWPTAKEWMRKGRDGKVPYAAFVQGVEEAKAKWACATTMRVTKGSKDDWKAGAWLLERRMREFAPPAQRAEIELKSADWLRAKLERIRRRATSGEFTHLTAKAFEELLGALAEG